MRAWISWVVTVFLLIAGTWPAGRMSGRPTPISVLPTTTREWARVIQEHHLMAAKLWVSAAALCDHDGMGRDLAANAAAYLEHVKIGELASPAVKDQICWTGWAGPALWNWDRAGNVVRVCLTDHTGYCAEFVFDDAGHIVMFRANYLPRVDA